MCCFAKPNAKPKSRLLSTLLCTHPPDKQIQRQMEQQGHLPPCHAADLQGQPSTTPYAGSGAGALPPAEVAHQPAHHSPARSPSHAPPKLSKRLFWHFPHLCRLGSQPQHGRCTAPLRAAGPTFKQAPTFGHHSPTFPHLPQRQTGNALQMVITFIDVRWYTNRSVSISLSTSPRLGEKLEEWGRQGNRTGLSLQDAELSGGEEGQGLQRRRVLLP